MAQFEQAGQTKTLTRRRLCVALAAVSSTGLIGCQARETTSPKEGQHMDRDTKDLVYFDVSAFDYYDRPIFEIRLNGIEIGSGGGALMTGVTVPEGTQLITWRLDGADKDDKPYADNGEVVRASNEPFLKRPDGKLRYLGVHIYPDSSVELVPEEFWPEKTIRGTEARRQLEKQHGK